MEQKISLKHCLTAVSPPFRNILHSWRRRSWRSSWSNRFGVRRALGWSEIQSFRPTLLPCSSHLFVKTINCIRPLCKNNIAFHEFHFLEKIPEDPATQKFLPGAAQIDKIGGLARWMSCAVIIVQCIRLQLLKTMTRTQSSSSPLFLEELYSAVPCIDIELAERGLVAKLLWNNCPLNVDDEHRQRRRRTNER